MDRTNLMIFTRPNRVTVSAIISKTHLSSEQKIFEWLLELEWQLNKRLRLIFHKYQYRSHWTPQLFKMSFPALCPPIATLDTYGSR